MLFRSTINTLSGAFAKTLQLPDIRSRLIDLGYDPIGGMPDDFAANLRTEMAKWAQVVKASGIRIE